MSLGTLSEHLCSEGDRGDHPQDTVGTWTAVIRKRGWPTVIKTFGTERNAKDWVQRTEDEMVRSVYIGRGASERVLLQNAQDRYQAEGCPTKRPVVATSSICRDFNDLCRRPAGWRERIERCWRWDLTGPGRRVPRPRHACCRPLPERLGLEADRRLHRRLGAVYPAPASSSPIDVARSLTHTRTKLLVENAHLRQQVVVLRWHRGLFKIVWRRKSRPKRPASRLAPVVVRLIQAIATANALSGAERIRGELLTFGIRVSKRTIHKYMREARPPAKATQTWRTFISADVWACDFLQHYNVLFRPMFALFFGDHGTREVVHFNVTRHATDARVTRQLREATPFGAVARYLVRDNDDKFGSRFAAVVAGSNFAVVTILPRSPNVNAICERFLASVRRDCLDRVKVLGNRLLQCILRQFAEAYFNTARPHQGLSQRIPDPVAPRASERANGKVVAVPILGGLHHDHRLAA